MFSRLNDATPLNAPEKRNALGGPIPPILRKMITHKFFTESLPFSNTRYRHMDLACKFMLLAHMKGPDDTKKLRLDLFVKDFKRNQWTEKASVLDRQCRKVISAMNKVFVKDDPLIKNVGMVVVYFLLFQRALELNELETLTRSKFMRFEKTREEN